MLRVYFADIRQVPERADGLPLSRYRLERLSSCKPELSRRQGIGAELLLIQALRDLGIQPELPLEIQTEAGGKPYLAGKALSFSLSHSGPYAACALADRPVGLDIQMLRPRNDSVVRRCFAPEEQDYVREAEDPDDAFTEIWCRKESVLKASGRGLSVPLASFSVLSPTERARLWHTKQGELHLSVCVSEGEPTPDMFIEKKLP